MVILSTLYIVSCHYIAVHICVLAFIAPGVRKCVRPVIMSFKPNG